MDNFYFLYIGVHASGCTEIDIGFWTTNVIGRTLCAMLHSFNGLPVEKAPGLWQDALDTGTDMIVKLPRQDRYKVLDKWHLELTIYKPSSSSGTWTALLYDGKQFLTTTELGDSGDCILYGAQKFYYESFDLPLSLAEFARLDSCASPAEQGDDGKIDEDDEMDEGGLEGRQLHVMIASEPVRPAGFWTSNPVGRVLSGTLAAANGIEVGEAADILHESLAGKKEVDFAVPGKEAYSSLAGWHITIRLVDRDGRTELLHEDDVLVSAIDVLDDGMVEFGGKTVDILSVDLLAELARRMPDSDDTEATEEAANPGDALLEKMNDEVMTEERAESIRNLKEEFLPPAPPKAIGETIPEEPAEVPKYVQMVHHEDPVVHPPVPKKPAEVKAEPATPGEPDCGFAGKLYRAAAMAVVKFGDAEDNTMTPRRLLHEMLPTVMEVCDGYLADPAGFGGGKVLDLSNYPDKILVTITRESIRLARIKFDVEETI